MAGAPRREIDKIVNFEASFKQFMKQCRPGNVLTSMGGGNGAPSRSRSSTKMFTFRMDASLLDAINTIASAEGRTRTSQIERMLHAKIVDHSVQEAEARLLVIKHKPELDPKLPPGKWVLDWSDVGSSNPLLYLSSDLFAAIRETENVR